MQFGGDNYDQSADDHVSDEENPSEDFYSQSGSEEQAEEMKGDQQQQQEQSIEGEDDQDEDDFYESQQEQQDILDQNQINEKDEPNAIRITTPYLTKYEKARVIGVRAVQISKNSPLYYSFGDNQTMDPLSMAQKQLQEGKIPFIIRRYLPDGSFQQWKLSQLNSFDCQ